MAALSREEAREHLERAVRSEREVLAMTADVLASGRGTVDDFLRLKRCYVLSKALQARLLHDHGDVRPH